MRHTRRHFLAGAATLALAHGGGPLRAWGQPRKSTRLILLGTKGGSAVGGQRRNPSTLMLINDVPYVVDCGTSTSQQLLAAGVALNRLRYVFLTHLHSDHMLSTALWCTTPGSPDFAAAWTPTALRPSGR